MRSVQEGVWFRTKARGNSESSAFRNEYSGVRMNKDTKQEIGQLLRGSEMDRRKDLNNSVNYVMTYKCN